MKPVFAFIFILSSCISASAISIATVPVGDVGNPSDPATGLGIVNYGYQIGKYEVTLSQYSAFLNAVAATDTYGLYNERIGYDPNIDGIARNGTSGAYSYSVIGSPNHPVTYVSWGDAARFANWLNNGQPTGPQNSSTTEDGAYALNGATSVDALYAVSRSAAQSGLFRRIVNGTRPRTINRRPRAATATAIGTIPCAPIAAPYSASPLGATPDNARCRKLSSVHRRE